MVKIELEIGDNLEEAINSIIKAVNEESERADHCKCLSCGEEIEKAFGIDFTKIIRKSKKGAVIVREDRSKPIHLEKPGQRPKLTPNPPPPKELSTPSYLKMRALI